MGSTTEKGAVLVAVSGGVDSSVAALLLAEQGYRIVPVTLKLYCYAEEVAPESCCSADSTEVARRAMERLGATCQVFAMQDVFRREVIEPFWTEYRAGRTPNPCVACNAQFRFPLLARLADELGCRYLATGHYCRTLVRHGRRYLARGLDPAKDQSYFLWATPRSILERLLFPLGELTKSEVREHARRATLPTASRPESQEVCFLPPGGYREVLRREDGPFEPGPILDESGRVLGRHTGIVNYTVGQRKGLGIAWPHPLYVLRTDPATNSVVVGPRQALLVSEVRVSGFRWFGPETPEESEGATDSAAAAAATAAAAAAAAAGFACEGAIRYRAPATACRVVPAADATARVVFDLPPSAPAPGQSLVLYRGDLVVGGGVIAPAPGAGRPPSEGNE